jgi:hypothetical protein
LQERRDRRRRGKGRGKGRGKVDTGEETLGRSIGGVTYERQRKVTERNRQWGGDRGVSQRERDRGEETGEETERKRHRARNYEHESTSAKRVQKIKERKNRAQERENANTKA